MNSFQFPVGVFFFFFCACLRCLPIRNGATFLFWDSYAANFYTVEVILLNRRKKKLHKLSEGICLQCANRIGSVFPPPFYQEENKKACCFRTSLAFCFQMLSLNSILLWWFIVRVDCEYSIGTHLLEIKKVKTFTSMGMLYKASLRASHSEYFWSDSSNLLRAAWEARGDCSGGTLLPKPSSDGQGMLCIWSICHRLRCILPVKYLWRSCALIVWKVECIPRTACSSLYKREVSSLALALVCVIKTRQANEKTWLCPT